MREIVVLVVGFSHPEWSGRYGFRDNRMCKCMPCIQTGDFGERGLLLARVMKENGRTVLRADIMALPVGRSWVMHEKKDVQQPVVTDLLRVKGDPDCPACPVSPRHTCWYVGHSAWPPQ